MKRSTKTKDFFFLSFIHPPNNKSLYMFYHIMISGNLVLSNHFGENKRKEINKENKNKSTKIFFVTYSHF